MKEESSEKPLLRRGDGDVPLCAMEAARERPQRNGETTEKQAAAYVELALWGITLAEEPGALRQWWTDEQDHRNEYGLSQAQIDHLVKACRERIGLLEGQAPRTTITIAPRAQISVCFNHIQRPQQHRRC